MDILAGLAAISEAIKMANAIIDIDKKFDQSQYKQEITNLISKIEEAKCALRDAKTKISELDEEINRLRELWSEKATLFKADDNYEYRVVDGRPVGYPVCPTCLIERKGCIDLLQHGNDVRNCRCPACHNEFRPVKRYLRDDPNGFKTEYEKQLAENRQTIPTSESSMQWMAR